MIVATRNRIAEGHPAPRDRRREREYRLLSRADTSRDRTDSGRREAMILSGPSERWYLDHLGVEEKVILAMVAGRPMTPELWAVMEKEWRGTDRDGRWIEREKSCGVDDARKEL